MLPVYGHGQTFVSHALPHATPKSSLLQLAGLTPQSCKCSGHIWAQSRCRQDDEQLRMARY